MIVTATPSLSPSTSPAIQLERDSRAWFASDLHLWEDRPRTRAAFKRLLEAASSAQAHLFLLGDVFEYWVGDDDLASPSVADAVEAMRFAAKNGVRLHVMHGNRDFLLGARFASHVGADVVHADGAIVNLDGARVLIMHGDTLCTDDVDYQRFRLQVRNPAYQANALAKPLAERHAFIAHLRAQSEDKKARTAAAIMDVNAASVQQAFDRAEVATLIHGHTHRPARHDEGQGRIRWVLPDWEYDVAGPQRGGWLQWDGREFEQKW